MRKHTKVVFVLAHPILRHRLDDSSVQRWHHQRYSAIDWLTIVEEGFTFHQESIGQREAPMSAVPPQHHLVRFTSLQRHAAHDMQPTAGTTTLIYRATADALRRSGGGGALDLWRLAQAEAGGIRQWRARAHRVARCKLVVPSGGGPEAPARGVDRLVVPWSSHRISDARNHGILRR
jgi:hypothetical protein